MALCTALVAAAAAFLPLRPIVEAEQRWQALQAQGVLRVAADPSIQPFSFFGASGWEGMDADVIGEAARRLGLRAEVVPVGYDGFYDALIAGYADVAMSALVVDPTRTADFRYSRPYFDAGLRVVAFAPLRLNNADDLRGRCVAAVMGGEADRLARWLERRTPHMSRRLVADEPDALATLRRGDCDAAIVSGLAAVRAGCAPMVGQGDAPNVHCLSLRPVGYVIALRRADARLADALNRALDEMDADGALARIARKWLADTTANIADTNDTNHTN